MSQLGSNMNSFNISNSFNTKVVDEESKILAWLSPLEPRVRHHDIRTQRVENVGDWLLQTKEYKSWRNGTEKDESHRAGLFCYGNPGAGKSFITSLVVDSLCDWAREKSIGVSCFYFDFASRKDQSPTNMFGSLLKQLVSGLEEMPEEVVEEYREQKKVIGGRGLEVSGILRMIQTVSFVHHAFICIDALDECVPENRFEVLDSLGQILQKSPNMRVFMTGRPHIKGEVERQLGGRAASLLITPTEHDIVMYLEARLKKDTTPEVMNSGLKEDIMRSIPEGISETLLLVSLNIEAILQETTVHQRRRRLRAMTDGLGLGLDEAYGATLERIRAQNGARSELAMRTLMWICYSERPLKVDELCHALAVEMGSAEYNSDNVPLIGTLIGFCQGLIMVDKEASIVRLIHHTLQEHLTFHLDLFPSAHSTIAETCLTYLNLRRVKALSSRPLTNLGGVPFLKYASRHWGAHARKGMTDHVKSLSMGLLGQYENHISTKMLLETFMAPECSEGINGPSQFTGIHCASFFGIVELVTALMERNGSGINKRDCMGVTPLVWAAGQGHIEMVKLLLEQKNADPNIPDKLGKTALSCAAILGHEGVVKLLLKRERVNPDMPDKGGRTPLFYAAIKGHDVVVKLLLAREEVDPNTADNNSQTPLLCAASKGHTGVLKLLLAREEVCTTIPDKWGRTPLCCAVIGGHDGIVKLLLMRDEVNPETPDEGGITPLSWAAIKGYEGILKLLLEREEVDANTADKDSQTPLLRAALNGHEGVVNLLLARQEISPSMPDKWGRTPICCASIKGHDGVVKLLLMREEVNPNMPDKNNQTPLLWAACKGQMGVLKLLLAREEVSTIMPDRWGRTPLCCAVIGGHDGIVKLLLAQEEVNPETPDEGGITPLSWAAIKGYEEILKLLLEREEVDPNMTDKDSQTPLLWAAIKGHEGIAKLLLEREEVDPNMADKDSRTPLWRAAANGHAGVVKLLLRRGEVKPTMPDKWRRAPI